MAWAWLGVAAKSIPWGTLVRRAPDIIDAAATLLASRKSAQTAESEAKRADTQVDALEKRIERLESTDQSTAEVVNQIAEQTRDLTDGIEILAAKVRLLSLLLIATAVLALIAVGIAAT